jgi:hypothetical protein
MASWIRDLLVPRSAYTVGNKGNWWMELGASRPPARGRSVVHGNAAPAVQTVQTVQRSARSFPVFPHDSVGLLVSLAAGGRTEGVCVQRDLPQGERSG